MINIFENKVHLAIVCITILEAIALLTGIDGQLFAGAIGAICTLAGYSYARKRYE